MPDSITAKDATDTTPRPPIWISISNIACPKADQYEAVSLTTSPVTHTAEVDVNNASEKEVILPSLEETGSIRSSAPIRITAIKPSIIT